MLLFFSVIFLINIIQINSRLDSCRQTFGSNTYDLNELSHLTLTGEQGIYRYALTPCGVISTDKCGTNPLPFEPGMTACQERFIGPSTPVFESAMGFLDGYGKTPNIEFRENSDKPGSGITMTMRNALCNAQPRLVIVIFTCDKSIETPTTMEVVEFPTCEFTIRISAAGACPNRPRPGPSGPSSGIAGGAVFLIILLVLISVYLIGGVSYNHFKEKRAGLALLPHPSFWLLLFGLFMDGCRFSLTYTRTCGKGSLATNYNSV